MNGFLSYSHDDHAAYEAFAPYLVAIKRAYPVALWTDHQIHTGSHWNQRIADAITNADLFVLLISNNFIASDYVWNTELPAIKLRLRAGALVLPIVLDQCFWQGVAPHLDAAPKEKGRLKPVLDWTPQRNGFNRAREQMMSAIATHFSVTPSAPRLAP